MPRATVKSNAAALLRWRSKSGFTQEEVADRAGYSKRQYERLEAGASTTLDTLACIAEVLRCPLEELIEAPGMEAESKRLVEHHFRKKELALRMRDATLGTLLPPSDERVSLVVRTKSKGDISLTLRPEATIGELTHAVPKEYLPDDYPNFEWLLTDADSDPYDITTTVGDLAAHRVSIVYLRKHQGLPLGIMTGPDDQAVRWCAAIAAVTIAPAWVLGFFFPHSILARTICIILALAGMFTAPVVALAVVMTALNCCLIFLALGFASGGKKLISFWQRRQLVRFCGMVVCFPIWIAFALSLAVIAFLESIALTVVPTSQEKQKAQLEKRLALLDQNMAPSFAGFIFPDNTTDPPAKG